MLYQVQSYQKNISMVKVENPFSMQVPWGKDGALITQNFPNGGYIKLDFVGRGTHGIQPCRVNPDNPRGWDGSKVKGGVKGYDKTPIVIAYPTLKPDELKSVFIGGIDFDGEVEIAINEESVICFNTFPDGTIDWEDYWVQKLDNVKKNYDFGNKTTLFKPIYLSKRNYIRSLFTPVV
jgi:hypothetical protein